MKKKYYFYSFELGEPVTDEVRVAFTPFFRGLSGAEAGISDDADNAIGVGSDDGLYAPMPFQLNLRFGEIAENAVAKQAARDNLDLEHIDCGTFN